MATTITKVRLNKGRCISGLDGVNAQYTIQLDGMENLYLPVKEEKNEADNTMMLYHFSCHLIRKDLMYNQREIRRQLQWQKNKGNTTWISKSRP